MTNLFIIFSLVFDLSTSQKTFENFSLKADKTNSGVHFSFYSNQYANVDLIVIEKYDKSQKIFNKIKDITVGDLESAKGDTFHFHVHEMLKSNSITEEYQVKFITKDRAIKIYNDIEANGVLFSNPAKGKSLLTKKNLNISTLSAIQKQALKKELKYTEQGYEVVKETEFAELAYNESIDKYFLMIYEASLECEKEEALFELEHYKFRMINSPTFDLKLNYYTNTVETTYTELDDSFIALFDGMYSVTD